MSRDAWFQNYERLYNEREAGEREGTDEELAELARERQVDRALMRAEVYEEEDTCRHTTGYCEDCIPSQEADG